MKSLIDDEVVRPIIEKLSSDIEWVIKNDYKRLPKGGVAAIFKRKGLTEWQLYGLLDDCCWHDIEAFVETYRDLIIENLRVSTI
jgi:hypothetical protein